MSIPHTHQHHALAGEDAVNFPEFTESGEHTDEYITHNKQGFIAPAEELSTPMGSSPVSTLADHDQEKGLDIKLVTWKDNDPEDPRSWPKSAKWQVFSCVL